MHSVKQAAVRSKRKTSDFHHIGIVLCMTLYRLVVLCFKDIRVVQFGNFVRNSTPKNGYHLCHFDARIRSIWKRWYSPMHAVVLYVWRCGSCDNPVGYRYTIIFSALIMSMTSTEAVDIFPKNETHTNITECSYVECSPKQIVVHSSPLYKECRYFIQAPSNHYITLNFTNFKSFRRAGCLPNITVVQVFSSGKEQTLGVICSEHLVNRQEQYFESSTPEVILTVFWDVYQPSELSVNFSFSFNEVKDFICEDGAALPNLNLVCNGVNDCLDASDEQNCKAAPSPKPSRTLSSRQNGGVMNIIVVVAAVVFIVAFILVAFTCVFKQCRLPEARHLYHPQRCDSSERNQLHSSLSTAQTSMRDSEVVYVQTHGRPRHTTQLTPSECRGTPGHNYTAVDRDAQYPPAIHRTGDGEEGYTNSQRVLQYCDYNEARGIVHAPPNKTVHEGESPPPYRAHSYSMGHLDKPAQLHKSARRDTRVHADWPRSQHEHCSNDGRAILPQDVVSQRQERLVATPVLNDQRADPFSFAVPGGYGSPRTARVLSAPDSSHTRTSPFNSSHSSTMGPPPYPPPEYSELADIDSVFTSSTVASGTVTSSHVMPQSVTSASASPCLHAS